MLSAGKTIVKACKQCEEFSSPLRTDFGFVIRCLSYVRLNPWYMLTSRVPNALRAFRNQPRRTNGEVLRSNKSCFPDRSQKTMYLRILIHFWDILLRFMRVWVPLSRLTIRWKIPFQNDEECENYFTLMSFRTESPRLGMLRHVAFIPTDNDR